MNAQTEAGLADPAISPLGLVSKLNKDEPADLPFVAPLRQPDPSPIRAAVKYTNESFIFIFFILSHLFGVFYFLGSFNIQRTIVVA